MMKRKAKLSRYRVALTKHVALEAVVEIEARNADEAEETARAIADGLASWTNTNLGTSTKTKLIREKKP